MQRAIDFKVLPGFSNQQSLYLALLGTCSEEPFVHFLMIRPRLELVKAVRHSHQDILPPGFRSLSDAISKFIVSFVAEVFQKERQSYNSLRR